ncbi:hypothetical protein PUN28_005930 [Cardiocondyla obscurior]|uniref:Uncharacterized protein n=1 Tax=Cardiocondyla obscurior TaxID=286306 RepID=A0AAW2G989_9HYME
MSYFPYFASVRGHLVTPPFLSNPPCIPPANVRLPPPPSLPPHNPRSPSSYPLWKMWLPIPFRPTLFMHYSDLPLPGKGNMERRQSSLENFSSLELERNVLIRLFSLCVCTRDYVLHIMQII